MNQTPPCRVNEYGQPVGPDLGGWRKAEVPEKRDLSSGRVTLEPLDSERHGQALFDIFEAATDAMWTYMPFGPFRDPVEVADTIDALVSLPDWRPYAVVVEEVVLGLCAFLRINPRDGVIEIGSIAFSPALQRTRAATEALHLMIKTAFGLGYRRCEWKCDHLNAPSRAAAERLGFRYEGTFRKATHYKGRSRDTAWLAITEDEWSVLEDSFQAWLANENFDSDGHQRQTLRELRQSSVQDTRG